jgi:LPPG:FO 2-phospho-L-lactate transferase
VAREKVAVLAGGVGAARLVRGLVPEVRAEDVTVIVNTADDESFYGLEISPDLDTIVYTLGGVAPPRRGWGLAGDTAHALEAARRFWPDSWFRLGDRDLATHLYRTARRREGASLSTVTAEIAAAFGVRSRVLPMTDAPVRTRITTRSGRDLAFQEWFVRRRARDAVARIRYRGIARARPAPGVLEALRAADLVVLPPSNPFTSLLPILGLRGVRSTLATARARRVAVSPVAGGQAIRGPLGGMLAARGLSVSPLSLARLYRGLVDGWVVDESDRAEIPVLERLGVAAVAADVSMPTIARSRAVARLTLRFARSIGCERGPRT